ncbi:Hypothetical predicted protein [Mytilus galloprovincialis]|uniref:Uncharacterized protein n=1 Tax=Mytilus galloprovincialis TaxID=29158 RepID=A0A8B6ELD7_MYTGA|nr:Hypothetical predicted protein [Mytilus galloprovincialis]
MEDLNEKFLSATMYGKVAEVQKYLDEGADLNYMDKTNLTALHKASAFGHIEIVCLLLDRGSDPNKNWLGDSALHLAAGRGHVDIVRLLIDHGSDLNMKNWDHMTPLHKAVLGVHLNIVKILMDSGSDPSITDVDNKTPHDVVQEIIGESEEMKETKRSIKKLLQEYGEFQKAGLPLEVQNLDKESASVFSGLLQDESYHHYEARIMLVGEPGIGKTTIARYLVGKGPTKFRVATDGIELYNDLLFMDGKTKQWLDGKQGNHVHT